jgi:hypothetical protein
MFLALFTKLAERAKKRRHAVQRSMERMRLSETQAQRLVAALERKLNANRTPKTGWVRIEGDHKAVVGVYGNRAVVKTVLSPHMHASGTQLPHPTEVHQTRS